GVREVPVVLHLLLDAPGGAASQVFLEVAGLLHDAVPGVQDTGLAFDLRADGPFDRTQGVDVLGLAAGTPLVGAALVDRHVHVTAHGTFLHAHVGDAQGTGQVTQLGGVGAGDQRRVLTGAGDGFGDDLQQRDPGTVVVDIGVAGPVDTTGRAAHVGGLTGVLLHVHPFDLHPVLAQPLGGVDGDVEVTIHTDRFVVLRDLVVLRHVRVEVVLPGEPAPRGDGAVQRQPEPDRALDRLCVDDRQRAGKGQADRAHLAVGFGPELGGA